jgi:hypothetical protein
VKFSRPDGQHHHQCVSPPFSAPPPLLGLMALGEACCRSSPPTTGVAGRAGRLAGTNTLPINRPTSNPAPSWASVVRDGACANLSAVSRQDFLALYERCSDSGLRTRLILRHQAGGHEITISCRLSASPSDANTHSDSRRRRRQRAPAAAAPNPAPPTTTSAPSQPPSTPHETLPLQKPPRRRQSGLEKLLSAGVRSSCCGKLIRKKNYS